MILCLHSSQQSVTGISETAKIRPKMTKKPILDFFPEYCPYGSNWFSYRVLETFVCNGFRFV